LKDIDVIAAIRVAVERPSGPVALHEPCFVGAEWTYVKECLDSGWVSSAGRFVETFESCLRDYTGVRCAIVVCSGTAALHLCLLLIGVVPGDEVLVPAMTFVATANAVAHCGAVPHFLDIEERSLGIDAAKLSDYLRSETTLSSGVCINRRTARRIRAMIPMHCFGHPTDMDALLEIAGRYHLKVVEDAAEALGSVYRGHAAGTLGVLGALSFNGNKIVTTGGGGAILTNDLELGLRAKHISTTARLPHSWTYSHDEVAYNYRMPNINAALGCAQLERLSDMISAKRRLATRYTSTFAGIPGMRIFEELPYGRSNYWLNVLLLDRDEVARRDSLLACAHKQGVLLRPAWTLLHELPMFRDCPQMELSQAEDLGRRIINLPSSAFLGGYGRAA
jgi:perosamine synthetase